jgi:tripartite ATP-independent transporter DctP family solute receptor
MSRSRKLIVMALTLTGALIFGTKVQAREFRAADDQPEDYPTVKAQKYMGELLNKATDGKYTVKVYHSGQLGSEKDTIEQIKLGAIDFLRVNAGPLSPICPTVIVPVMPFLFTDKQQMRRVLDGPIGDDILAGCTSQGIIGLAFYDNGSRSFYTTKGPINTLADIKGRKIRVQQSDLAVAMIRALGANPTPMPYGEVFTGLKTGLIDGAENNWPSFMSSHHYEVAKFYSLTEHSMSPEVLVMSKKVWDTLTPDDQKAIRQAAKASVPYMRKLWDEMEVAARAEIERAGVKVIDVDKAPFQAAMQPVYDQFVNGNPELKSLLQRIQAAK